RLGLPLAIPGPRDAGRLSEAPARTGKLAREGSAAGNGASRLAASLRSADIRTGQPWPPRRTSPAAVREGCERETQAVHGARKRSPRPRARNRREGQPSYGSRVRESRVDVSLRQRARGNARRLRLTRRHTHTP